MNLSCAQRELLCSPLFSHALSDLPGRERIKRFPPFCGVRRALKKTFRWDGAVCRAANAEHVPKPLIQAILFREILGFGVEDLLDPFRASSSRGLCQIRAATARKADQALGYPVMVQKEYERLLNHGDANILYCARIIRAEANAISADTAHMTDDEIRQILKKYNGSQRYANTVCAYAREFEKISENRG